MPGEAGPKQREDLPPRLFVLRIIQAFLKTLDWRVFSVLCATFLAYTWMLPQPERATKPLELLTKLADIVGGNFVPWIGWIVAIGWTLVGVPYIVYAQRRINSLGEYQRTERNRQDPGRLSSRDKNLDVSYVKRGPRTDQQSKASGVAHTHEPIESEMTDDSDATEEREFLSPHDKEGSKDD